MDSSSDRNNQRNDNSRDSNSDKVNTAVAKLFRQLAKNENTRLDFNKLAQEFGSVSVVEAIQKQWIEKNTQINKKAKKFAQLIRDKYNNTRMPFHIILEKARLFKSKYGLSDDEFSQFQRIYEQELIGTKSQDVELPITNMMKILGTSIDYFPSSVALNDSDAKILQDIYKLYASSKSLHAQVSLQSLQYDDCAQEALSGQFRPELGNRPGECIHPAVVALFLPKIDSLENHFLLSNISSIVKARLNNEKLTNRPDYEVFHSLINDPNDVVCDNKSSLQDLYNRMLIQNQLWECVLNLRNGVYYSKMFRDFVSSVDVCKLNKNDNPDLIYGKHDGTIIKRLLSSFSYRPTIVSTLPIFDRPMSSTNPFQQNIRPTVTNVSMINMKLPPRMSNNQTPISLKEAINSRQLFLENNIIVPRETNIIYSKGTLFFYVDRRASIINTVNTFPFAVGSFPSSVYGYENLNDTNIVVDETIDILQDKYTLRSVIVAQTLTHQNSDNIIIGSAALIIRPADRRITFSNTYIKYDPIKVTDKLMSLTDKHLVLRNPMLEIERVDSTMENSFEGLATSRGILFMYSLTTDKSEGKLRL
jgi:hypothetical protein